jgi:hypothetical protein
VRPAGSGGWGGRLCGRHTGWRPRGGWRAGWLRGLGLERLRRAGCRCRRLVRQAGPLSCCSLIRHGNVSWLGEGQRCARREDDLQSSKSQQDPDR